VAEEKSFLQTIKIEISRSFKLAPYERLSFHKILGILKSDMGLNILIKELEKGPEVRMSAISVLSEFEQPEALASLVPLLGSALADSELIMVLGTLKRRGGSEHVQALIEFIRSGAERRLPEECLEFAFDALAAAGGNSEEVLAFLMSNIESERQEPTIRRLSIEALSSFGAIAAFETILKKGDDAECCGVYRAIYTMVTELTAKQVTKEEEQERLFTYSPDSEDRVILEVRVLLGKMTHMFDGYSNKTKNSFICAMIACNHREYLIYTMKALTSGNLELVGMVLYSLCLNVARLRDPDKLFRSLIAFSTEWNRFNEMIVDVFVRYFSNPVDTRPFNLLRDKLYSYIVVTLETYFETYRKEFMITDVVEKGLPESFQRIRAFMLNNCSPELKKEIQSFLTQDDPAMVKHLVITMSRSMTHIEGSDIEDYALLLELLLDRDSKSRENSASRLEDLNFEKLYLRNRLCRLCNIIGALNIEEAASILVNIYNYLKKYPDREILEVTVLALATLNYSYMLGEIEVMLTTGSEEDRKNALKLLSLFTEQRSLNMILELLKNRVGEDSVTVETAIRMLLERDISGTITASQIFKGIVVNNPSPLIRGLAVLGIGRCGFDSDIDYLNDLFYRMTGNDEKDVIVRAIASIVARSTSYNKRQLVRHLQEYLKDPGIRVRIYSCLLLVRLGNREALRAIRDMLVIKNKSVQRDILTLLGDLESIEFTFFLLSLLKEEYGISKDVLPVMGKLPLEDMKEVDGFVVNIFRKYEAPAIEGIQPVAEERKVVTIDGLKEERVTILNIVISPRGFLAADRSVPDLITLNLRVKSLIAAPVHEHGGVITQMSNERVVAYFPDSGHAATAAIAIGRLMRDFNAHRVVSRRIDLHQQLLTGTVKIVNEEILEFPIDLINDFGDLPLTNRIIADEETRELLAESFSLRVLPESMRTITGCALRFHELLNPVNFIRISEEIIRNLREEEERRERKKQEIDAEIKKLKRERGGSTSVEIMRGLDDLGQMLQSQLDEIDRYVQKRSTDRELIKNVRKLLVNVHNLYKVEISRLIVE
jgi:HEAT repeat protein